MADSDIVENSNTGWLWNWNWNKSSTTMLRAAEKKILSCLKTIYRGWYVDIGPVVGTSDKIWTISLNEESDKIPIVLLHGFASGVALWCLNLDTLAKYRPVYAIDLLGFGRSSRPSFSKNAREAEIQLVNSVEEWRREMNLEKIILLGHSMGGFLATSYAIRYPNRVKHLILADPWGFPEKPADVSTRYNIPLWARTIACMMEPFNPLFAIRVAGPFGQWIVEKARPDIIKKYSHVLGEDVGVISEYIYQCNAQNPSGEAAFRALNSGLGWAKYPMILRLNELHPDIPMTFLYGSRSWVDNCQGDTISSKRNGSFVNVQIIQGAGHHLYSDKAEGFNNLVIDACNYADSKDNKKQNNNNNSQLTNGRKLSNDIESINQSESLGPVKSPSASSLTSTNKIVQ